MKQKAKKWSAAQRKKHAATIAARQVARATPIAERRAAALVTTTPAPVEVSGAPTVNRIALSGGADVSNSVKLIRAAGEGLVGFASLLDHMPRDRVHEMVRNFSFSLDLRANSET